MKLSNATSASTAVLALLVAGAVTARAQCGDFKESDRARLVDYVQKKYKVAPSAGLKVAEAPLVGTSCYRKVVFQSEDQKRRLELFLSPDLRFLTRELLDSSVDPIEEERLKQQVLEAGLARGPFPTRGPENAPVTLTVFSDFQCPFCAKLYQELKDGILPLEKGNVRLVFRYLPLPMHPWARAAAEAAACAQDQKNDFFWSLHDFLFDHRDELTTANLAEKLSGDTKGLTGFDQLRFESCVAKHAMAARVDQDVAFARENGISATPTLFVNRHRVEGAAPPEQILTLIHQLGGQAKAGPGLAGQ